MEKQSVVLGDGTDADVIALAEDPLEAAVQVFYVRGGRVRGQRGWVVDKVEDLTTGDLVEHFLQQVYGGSATEPDDPGWGDSVPREVLVPAHAARRRRRPGLADDAARQQRRPAGAAARRQAGPDGDRGDATPVRRSPCTRPGGPATSPAAASRCRRSRTRSASTRRRCGSSATTSRTCRRATSSRRWSCSRTACPARASTAGSSSRDRPGSQVRRRRRLHPRGHHPPVPPLRRGAGRDRRGRGAAPADGAADVPAGIDPETGRPQRFAYPPNLVVVDGGAPQVAAARRALDELGVVDVALCGLAKRLEEVWLPGDAAPGDAAAHQRGALPAAAGARRGAPVRDHLPPQPAVPLDDRQRAGRRPRPRRDPPQGAAASTSARSSGCPRPRWTRSSRCRASAGGPRRPWWPRWRAGRPGPAVNTATGEILDDDPQQAAPQQHAVEEAP